MNQKRKRWLVLLTGWGFILLGLAGPFLPILQGLLFLLIGLVSGLLLVLEAPTWKVFGLLAICVWCFCRFYYFAFYVIKRYVDPTFRFSGLGAFAKYLMRVHATRKPNAQRLAHLLL